MHISGAAIGGALAGLVIGLAGSLLRLPDLQPWILGGATLAAFLLALRPGSVKLGRQAQVPRRWASRMRPLRLFFLWGALLGSGFATLIPYSSLLLVFAAEATTGPVLAAFIGAIFGASRQSAAFIPVVRDLNPSETMDLLPRLRAVAAVVNISVISTAGVALVIATSLK
jgi:hypothetical protein